MADALELGYDLAGLCACLVALALLYLVHGFARALVSAFNVSVFGTHPFGGLATTLENTLLSWVDSAIKGVEKGAAGFFSGLIDSFGLLIGVPLALALALKDALSYLWNRAIMPRVHSATNPIKADASEALSKAEALAGTVAKDVARLDTQIGSAASAAYNSAIEVAGNLFRQAERDATAGFERGLSDLRGQLERELRGIEEGASSALGGLREAEQAAIDAIGSAEAATAGELRDLIGNLDLAKLAGAVAAVPVLAALVQALEAETGLDNEACRAKVKQICSTDPARWAKLLAGLALTAEWPGLVPFAEGIADMAAEIVGAVTDLAGV